MKIQAFAVSLILAVILVRVSASAASYIDNMDSLGGDGVRTYSGLVQRQFSNAAAAVVPDATAMTFSGGRLVSHADYRVGGATSVTASIYTHSGTFVCQDPNDPSQYMLGIFKANMDFLPSSPPQALYSAVTTGVYTREGGLKQAYTDLSAFYFGNVITPPQGELIGYGVNIYYSNDGVGFVRAQSAHSGLNYNIAYGYCLEYYTALVPSSATHIRVEINDFSQIPFQGGGVGEKSKTNQTALASVVISGASLVIGAPEEKETVLVPPFSTGYYSANTSAAKSSDKAPSGINDAEPGDKAESFATSSSKFEGTITSSSKPESSRSSRREQSAGRSTSSEESPASSSAEEIPRDETVVYEINRAGGQTGFDKGITAYIIVVSGVIVTLAVLPKRR